MRSTMPAKPSAIAGSIRRFYRTAATGLLDSYGLIDEADPLKARYSDIYPIAINQSGQVVVQR